MSKILNIGHRGARDLVLENTLESMEEGIKTGADVIEIDVRKTKDNVPVILHDPTLKRITGTDKRKVKKVGYKEFTKIKTAEGYKLPTLNEALDIISDRAEALLEIKDKKTAPLILDVLKKRKMDDAIYIFCDDPRVLKYIKRQRPKLRLGVLFHAILSNKATISNFNGLVFRTPLISMNFLRLYKKISPYFINAGRFMVTPKFVRFWQKKGLKVFVWQNIKTEEQMKKLMGYNVNGIVTDRPDILSNIKHKKKL